MEEWQGTIKGHDDEPLGTLSSVAKQLTAFFPGLSFEWSSSGAEKLAELDARNESLPEIVRRVMAAQPAYLCGGTESEGVALDFNLGAEDQVTCIWATVGGERELVEATLVRLTSQVGWVLSSPESLSLREAAPTEVLHLTGRATLIVDAPHDSEVAPAREPRVLESNDGA